MKNVIIFGDDHYNALGVARVFGVNEIKPCGLLVVPKDKEQLCYAKYSKYWKTIWFVENEQEGIALLLKMGSSDKQVLIPTSDRAETALDNNLDVLNPFYYLPGMRNTQGAVSALMDKYQQSKWAESLGLKTAKTWLHTLGEDIPSDLRFPCFLKPVASSEGDKRDIRKCDCLDDLNNALAELQEKHYWRILIQEYLHKDYEMELWGCIPKYSPKIPYLLSRHLREWPVVGGSVSCHQFLLDADIRAEAEKILYAIRDEGYTGNIDIELFMIQGEIYLNEVNFRNSGDVYACFNNKVFYPLIWYKDIIGEDVSSMNTEYSDKYYAMNEITDFKQVVFGNLSLGKWLHYVTHCKDFAFFFPTDKKPGLICVRGIFQRKLHKLFGF